MNGMELARQYYESCGAPMLHARFADCEQVIAAALTGSGSECYGYDDDVSTDHDFEPGFCLFLPGEDIVDRRTAFQLERAYMKLPAEFEGFRRQKLGPAGGARHGVFRLEEYFADRLGCVPEKMTMNDWLRLPSSALAEAVNGQVFRDDAGLLTDCRRILRQMPEDARKKRLAGHLLSMGQSGQYNYVRCLRHGEKAAAQLAAVEFVRHTMETVFLLHRSYCPFYKWSFRALRNLPDEAETAGTLAWLLTTDNEPQRAEEKYAAMESLAARVIEMLQAQELTRAVCSDLEKHAYSVNEGIGNGEVRNLHILCAV